MKGALHMKKSILIQLTALLTLAGCTSQDMASSSSGTDSGISSAASKTSASDTVDSQSSALTAEEIEAKCLEFLDNYYTGTKEADFDKCFGNFPDFYIDMLEKEVEVCGETHEEYMQAVLDDYKKYYGDDFDIKYQVSEENGEKGILFLYDDSIANFKDIIKTTYNKDVNLEEAYTVYITESISGSENSDSQKSEWFLLKIDGKYYLYENYYESNPVSETAE